MSQYKSRDAWEDTRVSAPPTGAEGPSPADERHEQEYELGNVNVAETPHRDRVTFKAPASRAPWMLAALLLVAGGLFTLLGYMPARRSLAQRERELTLAVDANAKLSSRNEQLERQRAELEASHAELQVAMQVKDQALAELTRTQDELAQKLDAEIQRGDVLINQRSGQLVVDLVDQILFSSGEAELNDQGKEVLRKVGETLVKVEDKIIQVGGHTDAVPISPKLANRFPSNWELSTARATNVVRFLQDEVRVPGERLVAAGFSQYRPTASNKTKAGQRKNRRIEVVLLPPLKPDPKAAGESKAP